MEQETNQEIELTHSARFMKGFNSMLPTLSWVTSLIVGISFAIYAYGSSQTTQASAINELQKSNIEIKNQIEAGRNAREADNKEIRGQMASKADVEKVEKQIQLLREENKETRDLLYRVLERQR